MAGLKEIKRRLKSVNNTKKITYAMKLVSAAKLRKAQEAVVKSRAYTEELGKLMTSLAAEQAGSDFEHPLMQKRESVKNIRLVVIGGGRGLCGGYNSNVNKKAEAFMREKGASANVEAVIVGKKPAEFFRRIKRTYLESFEKLPEDANVWPIDEICQQLEVDFVSGKFDEAYIIYTKFKSALSINVMCDKILPMSAEVPAGGKAAAVAEHAAPSGVTLFEPSAQAVFAAILPRVLRTRVRQAALDSKASEHGSRMTAMDAATKNASELSGQLRLKRNKLRQSGITAELLDIIGGAEAIS